MMPAVQFGTSTTGHSRPLALWIVSSFTESDAVGTACSSPTPRSSSASIQSRTPASEPSPSMSA